MLRRTARSRITGRTLLDRPEAVADYVALRFAAQDQEVVGALYLDVQMHLIGEEEIFRGCLYRALVEPRQILHGAIRHGAVSFILCHNHPSGDPEPTEEDENFTRRMVEAGKVLNIRLLDHLILGSGGAWVSLERRLSLPGW